MSLLITRTHIGVKVQSPSQFYFIFKRYFYELDIETEVAREKFQSTIFGVNACTHNNPSWSLLLCLHVQNMLGESYIIYTIGEMQVYFFIYVLFTNIFYYILVNYMYLFIYYIFIYI